ncbi:hypothetical protein HK405_000641, partial [Cladochytrium tenue]
MWQATALTSALTGAAVVVVCGGAQAAEVATVPTGAGSVLRIGFLLPYSLNDSVAGTAGIVERDVRANDAAAELAVQDIRNGTDILANTTVEIVRVNNWDPAFSGPANYYLTDSSGYAEAAAIGLIQDNQ